MKISTTVQSLPVGSSPAPLDFPHFPTPQQTLIWRNWEMIPVKNLARVLKTNTSYVMKMAKELGLPIPPQVSPLWLERGYCTLIRQNWHLLPYSQMLELLGWDHERMAFALREEDVLWVKLGCLKPNCKPVVYKPLTSSQQKQTEEIRSIIHKYFGKTSSCVEKPFEFLNRWQGSRKPLQTANTQSLRLVHSYSAPFGDPFLDPKLDPYPDRMLDQLAEQGINGVWLPALLYSLVEWKLDPFYSKHYEIRLKNLRQMARRIERKGMGLYLYLNEPRALPSSSKTFRDHPELKGAYYPDWNVTGLCSSNPWVLDWLRESTATLFKKVPELAGVLTITMSEFPTNCFSRKLEKPCPRCKNLRPEVVVSEINNAIEEGVHRSKPSARVIAWSWAWEQVWEKSVVDRLSPRIDLMCVSEWGLPLPSQNGEKHHVVDYSISKVGPSQRSMTLWKHARKRGLKTVAKIQANNSWELCAVPYLPVPHLVEEHVRKLRKAGVSDLMMGWTLGGYPGGNLSLADGSTQTMVQKTYGQKVSKPILKSLKMFSVAFKKFPFSCAVIYLGAHNAGPHNLLFAKKTNYQATMVVGNPYDDLKSWHSIYREDFFIHQIKKISVEWKKGLDLLMTVKGGVNSRQTEKLKELKTIALATYCHFRSFYLQMTFIKLRDQNKVFDVRKFRSLLIEEIELAKELHDLMGVDSRIGFEAANHYIYTQQSLKEKIINCEYLLNHTTL